MHKSLDTSSIEQTLVNELVRLAGKAHDEGEKAGEAAGEGIQEGLDNAARRINAKAITSAFKNLRKNLEAETQQMSARFGKNNSIKVDIDFSSIDTKSKEFKGKVSELFNQIKQQSNITFETKAAEEQFKNLLALYSKYSEAYGKLSYKESKLTINEDKIKNLEQQYVLLQQIAKITKYTGESEDVYAHSGFLTGTIHKLQELYKVTNSAKPADNFSGIIQALTEIKNLIGEVKTAFQPLTDSMSKEGSAISKMLNASADEVTNLIKKFTELHEVVNQINKQGLNGQPIAQATSAAGTQKTSGSQLGPKYETIQQMSLFDGETTAKAQQATAALVTQTNADLEKIKAKIDEVFDFSKINPNYGNIQTITDQIYKYFTDLQTKVNSLEFKFSAEQLQALTQLGAQSVIKSSKDSATPLGDEASKLKEVDAAAKAAADGKSKFAAANKQVQKSAEASAGAIAAEVGAMIDAGEAAASSVWQMPRNGDGTIEGLNLPVRFIGENGQSATGMFAEVKSEIETLTGSPVTISFMSKPNEAGQLEAVGASIKYINEAAGVTVKQFYDIKRNEEGIIEATQSTEQAILGAAKAAKTFNAELQQQFAQDQIKTLKAQMGDLKLDLTAVTEAASNINDKASLEKFNLQLKIAKEQAKQLKAELKGNNSLDVVAAAQKTINTLPDTLNIYRQKLQGLMGVQGTAEINNLLGAVENNLANFLGSTDTNYKANVFKDIIADLAKIKVLLQEVKGSESFKIAKDVEALDKKYKNLNDSLEKYKNNLSLVQGTASHGQAQSLMTGIKQWQDTLAAMDKSDPEYAKTKLYILQQIDDLYGKLQSKMSLIASEQKVINAETAKQKKAQAPADMTAQKQQQTELNDLFAQRSHIISNLLKLDRQINNAQNDEARNAAQQALELEKQRLDVISSLIRSYGDLVNQQKLATQDTRLVEGLRTNAHAKYIKVKGAEGKAELDAEAKKLQTLIALQKEYYDNTIKFTQAKAGSQEEDLYLRRAVEAQDKFNQAKQNTILTQEQSLALSEAEVELQKRLEEAKVKNSDKQADAGFKNIRQTYAEYTRLQEAITKMQLDTSGKDHSAQISAKTADAVKLAEKLLKLGIDVNDIDKSSILTQEQKNALLADEERHRKNIKNITSTASDAETAALRKEQERIDNRNKNYGKSTYNSAEKKYEQTEAAINSLGIVDPQVIAQLDAYKSKLAELKAIRDQFASDPTAASNESLRQRFNQLAYELDNCKRGFNDVIAQAQELDNIASDPARFLGRGEIVDPSNIANVKAGIEQLAGTLQEGKVQINSWSEDGTKAFGTIDKGRGIIEDVTIALKKGTGEIIAYKNATNQTGTAWQNYKAGISSALAGLKRYTTYMFSAYRVIAMFRNGINSVKEIDAAMTELKKVTDETSKTYDNFLKIASQKSSEIGTTMKEFIESTSDFARLGYTIEEATELSRVSNIYANVGDDISDVSQASESIISTMKAFKIEAADAITIIDRFNEVGNNFAISSGGIGEALQRSASALYEAGNTIDESIALITAANSVIQNPDQVGTAMKTLSLRLRGAKVELEESGLEVDGMADSVASLREKLLALTGQRVDIMLNDNTFKSTTQILREMSEVWEDMSDVSQAAALELMGGKRQANILASVISNFDIVEDVISKSMDSENSALAENQKYLNSIQGHLDILKNSTQNMWVNAINSDVFKFFVDIATAIVNLVDKIGMIPTALTAASIAFSVFKKKNLFFGEGGLWGVISGGKAAKNDIGVFNAKPNIKAQEKYAKSLEKTNPQLSKYLQGQVAATKAANQNAGATATASASQHGFAMSLSKTTIKAAALKVGLTALNAVASLGVGILLSFVATAIYKGIDAIIHRVENLKEKVEDLTTEFKNAKEEFSENLKDLTTPSDADTYATLLDEFKELAKGVDSLGNNLSLTSDEYARYQDICETIVGVNPDLAEGYDSVTEAVGNNVNILERLIELQEIAARQAAQEYLKDENLTDIAKEAKIDYSSSAKNLESVRNSFGQKIMSYDIWGTHAEQKYGDVRSYSDDRIKEMLETYFGYTPEQVDEVLEDYYGFDINTKRNAFKLNDWLEDNADFIADNSAMLPNEIKNWAAEYRTERNKLESEQKSFIYTLKQVPMALEDIELSTASNSFLMNWIENSGMFLIDKNFNEDVAKEWKETVENMARALSDNKEIQKMVDGIYDIDMDEVSWDEYTDTLSTQAQAILDTLGGEDNEYGLTLENIKLSFGFDEEQAEKDLNNTLSTLASYLGYGKGDAANGKVQDFLNGLSASQVQAILKVDWSAQGAENIRTWQDVFEVAFAGVNSHAERLALTYDQLQAQINSFNEVSREAAMIMTDGTKISEDLFEKLKEFIDESTLLSMCIKDNNGYIVKNADLLQDIIKLTGKNILSNTKLARSHARLKYYELYKQIKKVIGGKKELTKATRDQVSALFAEMNALEKNMAKYSLLEQQLLGTADAFKAFEDAQSIDEENDYIGKVEEMAVALGEAFSTAELGSQRAQVAIGALVPTSVFEDLDTVDEKMAAIDNYFKNDLSKYITIEYDDDGAVESAEMMLYNLRTFIEDGLGKGVFEYQDGFSDWMHFDLSDEIDSIGELAEAMNVTKEVAFAFLQTIEDHDIEWLEGDYTSLLEQLSPQTLEYKIFDLMDTFTEFEDKIKNGGMTEEDWEKYFGLDAQMEQYAQEARDSIQAYQEASDKVTELENKLADANQRLANANETIANAKPNSEAWNAAKQEVVDATAEINKYTEELKLAIQAKYALEEPTEMTVQLALDDIDAQQEEIANKIGKTTAEIEVELNTADGVALDPETGLWKIEADAEISDELREYIDLLNEEHVVSLILDDADTKENLTETIDLANQATEAIENIPDKVKVDTGAAEANLKTVIGLLSQIQDKNVKVTVTEEHISTNAGNTAEGGGVGVNGTAHLHGTAHASGSWGAPRTETALTGELGPELRVRGNRWDLLGEHGAEFSDIQKGDIIFNHKQTESLLKNGYVTSRGKAYAGGTAYATLWPNSASSSQLNGSSGSGGASDAVEDAAEHVVDFIEIKLEEIEKLIAKITAKIENLVDDTSQAMQKREKYDELIAAKKDEVLTNRSAAEYYNKMAEDLLKKVPAQYREMAKNGAINVTTFMGEAGGKVAEAIEKYREYANKAHDAEIAALEGIAEISEMRLEAIKDLADDFDNVFGLIQARSDLLQSHMDLVEASGIRMSEDYYKDLIKDSDAIIAQLEQKQAGIRSDLNEAVRNGEIAVGSDDWYEAVNMILECDEAILDCKKDTEDWKNEINELKWTNLEKLIAELDSVESQLSHLFDLLSEDDKVVDDMGKWTDEGITSLGLLAQQMELAQHKSQQYADAIKDLEADYKAGLYSTDEYNEKLAELTEEQWSSIEAYEQAKDAIVDLNKVRIDAVKEGIKKEIDAYKELIDAKKESLDMDKEAHDFEKQVAEKQKSIAIIQRQLAAIANDNSAAAMAKRKQLQAELLAANTELEEFYYDHSIDTQKDALDKEYENFEKNKQDEMDALDEWLEQQEIVIQESLDLLKYNAEEVFVTINKTANEYGIQISDAIVAPWENGENAIDSYIDKLNELLEKQNEIIESANEMANKVIEATNQSHKNATESKDVIVNSWDPDPGWDGPSKDGHGSGSGSGKGSSGSGSGAGIVELTPEEIEKRLKKKKKDPPEVTVKIDKETRYNKAGNLVTQVHVAYAKGTTNNPKDQLALIDELGEELVLTPGQNGRLQYLAKGASVIPADLTERLMEWGELDPSEVIKQSKPKLGLPHITTNNFDIDLSFGSLVHVDAVNNDTLPELQKMVRKEFDGLMKGLNNSVKRYTR